MEADASFWTLMYRQGGIRGARPLRISTSSGPRRRLGPTKG